MAQAPITKSIDVGSMFLMDMSVCESEPPACDPTDTIPIDINSSASNNVFRNHDSRNIVAENHHHVTRPNHSMHTSIVDDCTRSGATGQMLANLSSSFDVIASVINSEGQQGDGEDTPNDEYSATVAETLHALNYNREPQSYSSSGGSFVDSSGTSLSASYTIGSEPGHEDRDSTTTREDSGVLDMKDLQDQLINSYDNEWDEKFHLQHSQHFGQEQPISSNIIATNLINNKSVNTSNLNSQQQQQQQQTNYISKHSHRLGKPTEGNDYHNYHNSHSKHSMSASVPIQVPVRQMKKDLNKMKLKLMKEELENFDQNSHHGEHQDENEPHDLVSPSLQRNCATSKTCAWDDDVDDDAFLEQEYNESHHNRYPLNYDDEHPRAGEDPMKLFASIQALAKSLHEDAELFGSLPPKRLLESPIRSIALV